MHHNNAPCNSPLVTWEFLVMNQILTVTNQPHFSDPNPCCFCVFMRIKNGLKIRSFCIVRKIQQKATASPRAITSSISRASSTNLITALSRVCVCVCVCECRRALMGVTGLGFTHILCTYFA